jgi:hypothetical protein
MNLSRSRGVLAAIVLAIGLLIAGCASGSSPIPSLSGEPAALHVANVDGPDVSLLIAGNVVAVVRCGSSASFEPGGSMPSLPWELTVRASDGEVLQSVSVSALPEVLLVRGRGVLTGPWPMSYGPPPDTTCEPAAS